MADPINQQDAAILNIIKSIHDPGTALADIKKEEAELQKIKHDSSVYLNNVGEEHLNKETNRIKEGLALQKKYGTESLAVTQDRWNKELEISKEKLKYGGNFQRISVQATEEKLRAIRLQMGTASNADLTKLILQREQILNRFQTTHGVSYRNYIGTLNNL